MSDGIGKHEWAISGGPIPLRSTGVEPAMTSRDELRLLNTGGAAVAVTIFVHYADRDPVGEYTIQIKPRRLRRVRINDLIDPLPVPLETEYGLVVRADHPIVVQFTRTDTSSAQHAIAGTVAYRE